MDKVGDLGGRKSPGVPAETIGDGAERGDDGARDAERQRRHDGAVVPAQGHMRDQQLVAQPEEENGG